MQSDSTIKSTFWIHNHESHEQCSVRTSNASEYRLAKSQLVWLLSLSRGPSSHVTFKNDEEIIELNELHSALIEKYRDLRCFVVNADNYEVLYSIASNLKCFDLMTFIERFLCSNIQFLDASKLKSLAQIYELKMLDYEIRAHRIEEPLQIKEKPSKIFLNSCQIYALGGYDTKNIPSTLSASVDRLALETDQWTPVTSMPAAKHSFEVATVDERIVVMGGLDEMKEPLNCVEVYNIKDDCWDALPPMGHRRWGFAVSVFNDAKIYAAGGIGDEDLDLCSVESFDLDSSTWKEVAPMLEPRFGLRLIALDRFLYAIGGLDTGRSVERYDSLLDEWRMVAPTHFRYHDFGAVQLDNRIFVCGRYGFECYDPTLDEWTVLPSPNKLDIEVQLSIIDDGILLLTGGRQQSIVDTFDLSTQQWNILDDAKCLKLPRSKHSLIVMNNLDSVQIQKSLQL